MKLIIGLGNPGKQYETTRHNVGFLSLDDFAKKNNIDFKNDTNFKAHIAQYNNMGKKAILLKPQTYMNLSGESIIKVMNYYKIDVKDIIVIYDDITIPLESVRIRETGSAGGHNGIKNMILHLKTDSFKRVKLGVSNNTNMELKDFVLSNFSKDEMISLSLTFDNISKLIEDFINDTRFDLIMNNYNKRV